MKYTIAIDYGYDGWSFMSDSPRFDEDGTFSTVEAAIAYMDKNMDKIRNDPYHKNDPYRVVEILHESWDGGITCT